MSTPTTTTAATINTNHQRAKKAVSTAAIWIMFVVGVSTTCLAPLLVGNVIYVLGRIVVPSTTLPGTFPRYAHIAAISWFSFGIVFNFIMAAATHAGSIPSIYIDACQSYLAKNPTATLRHCDTCKIPRAPRSHHCAMCGECIIKSDHHCVWINGCTGYHNYRYFFGFLFWLLCGTIYSFSSCSYMLWFHDPVYHHAYDKVAGETNQVFFIFVLTVAIAITMLLFVGFGVYGMYYNLSALEFHISKEIAASNGPGSYRNPYDLGYMRNFVEALGPETTPWELIPLSVLYNVTSPVFEPIVKGLRLIWLVVPNVQLMPHEGVWYPTNAAALAA